jgi:hypothetical protein
MRLIDVDRLRVGADAVDNAYLDDEVAYFDPRSLPNLRGWWDARWPNGIGVADPADGAAVSSWKDLSGSGQHLVQTTVGQEPKFKTSAAHNLVPRIEFDPSGASDWINLTTFPAMDVATLSTYVVTELYNGLVPAQSRLLQISTGGIVWQYSFDPSEILTYAQSGGSSVLPALALNTPVVISTKSWDVTYGGATQAFMNGVGGTLNGIDPVGLTGSWLRVGGPSGYWDGSIAAILFYEAIHTDAQRKMIEQWLGRSYKIAITP